MDDYAIAQVAKVMGKANDYKQLMKLSKNYQNLYDAKSGFMLPRKLNGQWDEKNAKGQWLSLIHI